MDVDESQDSHPWRRTVKAAAFNSILFAEERYRPLPGEVRPISKRKILKPIGENQLYKSGNPVGIKSLIADFVFSVLLPGIVARVRPGAVEVGKSVLPGQCPGTEDASAFLFDLRIRRKRYHRTPYVP